MRVGSEPTRLSADRSVSVGQVADNRGNPRLVDGKLVGLLRSGTSHDVVTVGEQPLDEVAAVLAVAAPGDEGLARAVTRHPDKRSRARPDSDPR